MANTLPLKQGSNKLVWHNMFFCSISVNFLVRLSISFLPKVLAPTVKAASYAALTALQRPLAIGITFEIVTDFSADSSSVMLRKGFNSCVTSFRVAQSSLVRVFCHCTSLDQDGGHPLLLPHILADYKFFAA